MKHKRSKYNIIIAELPDNSLLVYNTYSGLFGRMDEQTRAIYENIEEIDIDLLEGEPKKNADIMLHAGYIVDNELDEVSLVLLQRNIARHNTDALGFTIAPTMDCNMCCQYCYEKSMLTI